jgi:hypothetical protein
MSARADIFLEPVAVTVADAARLVGFRSAEAFAAHYPHRIFKIGSERRVRVADVRAWIDQLAGAKTMGLGPGARLASADKNIRHQNGAGP